jgi:DNA-directed RNA polymerase specialized sigma24 family protein
MLNEGIPRNMDGEQQPSKSDDYGALFRKLECWVQTVSGRRLPPWLSAEDVVAEAFTRYFNNREAYKDDRGSLGSFLAGIARKVVLHAWDKDRRFSRGIDCADCLASADPWPVINGGSIDERTDRILSFPLPNPDLTKLQKALRNIPWSSDTELSKELRMSIPDVRALKRRFQKAIQTAVSIGKLRVDIWTEANH